MEKIIEIIKSTNLEPFIAIIGSILSLLSYYWASKHKKKVEIEGSEIDIVINENSNKENSITIKGSRNTIQSPEFNQTIINNANVINQNNKNNSINGQTNIKIN
jgi:hypothetical protein